MAATAALSSSQEHELPLRGHGGNFHLDDPFTPPPSAQAQAHLGGQQSLGPSEFAQLAAAPELRDIDDFDREHAGPQLVALGTNKSKVQSANIVKLQHLCDQHNPRLQPEYELEEVYQQNFKGRVVVAGEPFEATGLYPSKVQAKDAAAKTALERLPAAILITVAGVKRKAAQQSVTPADRSENWVGILMQNFAQKKTFEPEFEEYQTNATTPGFLYRTRLNQGPIDRFDGGVFSKKADAKAASAQRAVEWLRSNGHLETPVKRPRPSTEAGHTGLTQAFSKVDFEVEVPEKPLSIRQRVYELAAALGFQQPSCPPKQCTINGVVAGSFYTVTAMFSATDIAREPLLAGPIQVENVFGKERAKEACCEKVLPVLEEIKRRRLGA